jgi:CHAD domain-containing protein
MERVLEECDKAGRDFAAETVHNLRIALRRCRTMANGLMIIDPDKTWRAMRKEGGRLFRSLGELRDAHVMMEWVRHLSVPNDPVAARLLDHLAQREQQLKQNALEVLHDFDRQKWSSRIKRLQMRARRVPMEGQVFQLSALQAWDEAYQLHKRALRNRSVRSFHGLRIGLKKLRYTVENFLPRRHEQWGRDFKELQDCLGELHDLAVLWDTAIQIGAFPDAESRARWRAGISQERRQRIERYRQKMLGPASLWSVWRAELPSPKHMRQAALQTIQKLAYFLGSDLDHARHVRRLALQLHNGLKTLRPATPEEVGNQRSILHAAAIMHEAGGSTSRKKQGKAASRLIRRLPPFPGFPKEFLLLTAIVVRYHCGALRILEDKDVANLQEEQRQVALQLAGILRLAETLAQSPDQPITRVIVRRVPGAIIIETEGYTEIGWHAEKLAQARYLLEFVYSRPVIIRSTPDPSPQD